MTTDAHRRIANESIVKYELFNDGPRRWVLTQNYDEDNAPVFESIQAAYDFAVSGGEPFVLLVHRAAAALGAEG